MAFTDWSPTHLLQRTCASAELQWAETFCAPQGNAAMCRLAAHNVALWWVGADGLCLVNNLSLLEAP